MPIRPENRARYPSDWTAISRAVKDAAGWCCEGIPDFPDCRAAHGQPHPETGSRVVLTTAHLDHQPENCDRANLRALCQRRHLHYDRHHHAATRDATRRAASRTPDMFAPESQASAAAQSPAPVPTP